VLGAGGVHLGLIKEIEGEGVQVLVAKLSHSVLEGVEGRRESGNTEAFSGGGAGGG
jgi:hypothetical protein